MDKMEYPTPFVLHFSRTYLSWYEENPEDYILKMKGTDVDLAAHFMIIKKRGITLHGKPIDQVFGEIQETAYMESIREDIADAKNMVVGDPVYTILSLCRVVAFVEEGLVLSKKEGGEWGLQHVKEPFHKFILEALSCYESDEMMETGEEAIPFLTIC